MAAARKSAQQLAAREKARAKAQELTARHEKMIDLAAEFFERQETAEQVRAEAQRKADEILVRAEQDADRALTAAAGTVKTMVDAGEPKAAVAARLGLTGAEVKKMLDIATTPATDAPTESVDAVDETTDKAA